jgi:hypothetical protein
MQTIEQFVTERLRGLLATRRVLTVYDPERRYRDVVAGLASAKVRLVELTDDVIGTREEALEQLRDLGGDPTHAGALVLYLPRPQRLDDAGRCQDPFTPVALAGAVFPDGEGHSYLSLCQQFLPDEAAAIEELFKQGEPSFEVINGLRSGAEALPVLSQLLNAEGAREILIQFLCLSGKDSKKLEKSPHWQAEMGTLCTRSLGLELGGGAHKVEDVRGLLWRFVLFSEFASDLSGTLPTALTGVKRASGPHLTLVRDVCAALRDRSSAQAHYEEYATRVAEELNLEQHCAAIQDFGHLDTFAFEERTFLRSFAKKLLAGEVEEANRIVEDRAKSFWIRDAGRSAQWRMAACCLTLQRGISEVQARLKAETPATVSAWIDFHVTTLHRLDASHRELEQVAQEAALGCASLDESLAAVRGGYRETCDRVARLFQESVAKEGWPASGRRRATDTFEQYVRVPWAQGKRIVYFWVDALRYDLAKLLEQNIATRHGVTVEAACAQLPTITRVSMAALLPGAETDFKLVKAGDEVTPQVKGVAVSTVSERFQLVEKFLGAERTRLVDLDDLVPVKTLPDFKGVAVLVVKTTEIDLLGENNPGYFMGLIPDILRKLQVALNRLADAGFDQAVLATDHGFCWFDSASAGAAVSKPAGDWVEVKNRSLLGSGQATGQVLSMDAPFAGVRGDIPQYVAARGMATFTKGVCYFHEGLSPQECIIPVMQVALKAAEKKPSVAPVELVLTYRGATTGKVTTLRPSVEVSCPGSDLFGPSEVRFLLEGRDAKDKKVADAAPSLAVDPATNEVTIHPGQALKVPIRIEEGFSGTFVLRALNCETGEIYGKLKLETDFHH